ncbi:MAG: TonB-dependent receptor [Pseudohongiellaceae bacterium]
MKPITTTALALAASLSAFPGHGQTSTNGVTEEIIVSANRFAQPAGTVMAATSVITREEITRSLAQNLADLLSGKPGIQMAQSGGRGALTSLFMRGTESDHTLILIDGAQITTSTGSSGRLEYVPTDQIERIEIIRGPRSSLWGSEAIGGVINIVTARRTEADFDGSVRLAAGTENSRNGNANLAGNLGGTALNLGLSKSSTDGINFSRSGSPDDDGYDNESLTLGLHRSISDDVALSLVYSDFDASSEFDDGEVDSRSRQLSATLDYSISPDWTTRLTANRFKEDNDNRATFGDTISRSENASLRWSNTLDLNGGQTLGFGVDRQRQQLDYASFGATQSENSRDNTGYYGVYNRPLADVDLTLSIRNDDNEAFGHHTTGNIAVGKAFGDNTRAWLSYGTAFKAPNLLDLYVGFPDFSFFANPDLQPETSENIEFGLALSALGGDWSMNLFHNEIENLISIDASFTTLDNVDKAVIDGFELTFGRDIMGWNANVGLTLLNHEDRSTGEDLLRRPEQTVSASLGKNFGRLDFSLQWLAQSKHRDVNPETFGSSEVGGYGIVNFIAGYHFSNTLGLRLRLGNVLDKDYEVVDGFNTLGRTAQLSMDYQF